MRVLVAPDKFAGTLDAVAAASAIAEGWRRVAPHDDVDMAPVSDGGPGFIDVLEAAVGGDIRTLHVTGPTGRPVPATVLRHEHTIYMEAAQACGLDQLPVGLPRDPTVTTTYGLGELLADSSTAGHVVVGLGGSATNDGGAGMLAALGARPGEVLRRGGLALGRLGEVDLEPARDHLQARIVAATDVDNPLLGPGGASAVFGPQKGATQEQVAALDGALKHWAALTDPELAGSCGAGAAGGLGHGLFLLGGYRESGIAVVLGAAGVPARVDAADLVVTGEGSFDAQSLEGKAVSGVAEVAAARDTPCVVLAGRVAVSRQDMVNAGIHAAYAVSDSAGSVTAAMAQPASELARLAERTAAAYAGRTRDGW